jgi:hypothetical protein
MLETTGNVEQKSEMLETTGNVERNKKKCFRVWEGFSAIPV